MFVVRGDGYLDGDRWASSDLRAKKRMAGRFVGGASVCGFTIVLWPFRQ